MATIVIPVQIGSAWLLYITERSGTQTTLWLASGVQNDMESHRAIRQLDALMQSIGRGALDIWLRMVMRDITVKGDGSQREIENLQRSISLRDFQIIKATHFAASEVTPGVLCMFFIRMLVSTANSQISTLRANHMLLQTGEVGGVAAADHTRGVMQFSLAADRMLGSFFDPEGLEEEGLVPRPNTQRGGFGT